MHRIDVSKRQFNLAVEHDLSKTEDAPMSIAVLPEVRFSSRRQICVDANALAPQTNTLVAGINSGADKLKEGVNENLRVFSYDDTS
jgi:prolactin regulatory element-binding protein